MSKNIDTTIGDDIVFRGKLSFKKDLQINGKFKGQIHTTSELVVGPTSQVEADIEAGIVTIQGNLTGNIVAQKKVDLLKSGRVKGDIHAPDLRIESGALFSGNSSMNI